MDKQQIFLANNIFDIDSALDSLEEKLFTSSDESREKSPLSQQQKLDVGPHKESQEENGNVLAASDNHCETKISDKKDEISDNVDDSRTADDNTTTLDDVIKSEVFGNGVGTQTLSVTSFSVEDKSSISLDTSSSSSDTEDSSSEARGNLENISTVTNSQQDCDDSSKQLLISEESTNPHEGFTNLQEESTDFQEKSTYFHEESTNYQEESTNYQEESTNRQIDSANLQEESTNLQVTSTNLEESTNVREEPDDQPLTTDLTLTKTVDLTENEPDPEPEVVEEPPPPAEPIKKFEIPQPIEMMLERPIDDFKEMSLNNFESTMDDISDNELESLEQELEELVGGEIEGKVALKSIGNDEEGVKVSEEAVKPLEEAMKPLEETVKPLEEAVKSSEEPAKSPEEAAKIPTESVEKVAVKAEVKKVEEVTPTAVIEVIPEPEKPVEAVLAASVPSQVNVEPPVAPEVHEPFEETPSKVQVNDEDQRESSASEAHEAVEPSGEAVTPTDPDPALSSSTDESTSIQNLPSQSNEDFSINESVSTGSLTSAPDLGRVPPYWIPDETTNQCMQCDAKFTLIKRRHHCRACGLLLCSACCGAKFFLHYLGAEDRVCTSCHETLVRLSQQQPSQPRNPNPANPMEYCSTLPPQQQVTPGSLQPPTVMVPSGVLKRGPRSTERKSVIFSDGIRPGTDLDETATGAPTRTPEKPPKFNMPTINEKTNSFIPEATNELSPVLLKDVDFSYVDNNLALLQRLRQEELKFAINKNFFVTVKIVTLICCTNKTVINFSTAGLLAVRQDELMILLELNDDMVRLPKEVFLHLNEIYVRADKGNAIIKEYGHSQTSTNNFLGAFGGFLYIKPSFQCQQSLTLPETPYLIGLLVHKWEIPWMRLFPLRLILRLGALHRYYPTPILSNVNREPVFAEIGNTVMNFLADFRNFSYTIDIVKGLNIHMEERKTSVFIPKNRYDQIMKVINNSSDHLLAFGADFSKQADGHLVCIQNIDSGTSESLSYSTQAINIQGQNRIRTGASFLILNGALKASSGLKAKCSIVEDGLMIQISATKMQNVRDALKNMKNVEIACGPLEDTSKEAEETVSIEWIADDVSFNVGVLSPIDSLALEGKESIRTRLDFTSPNHTKMLRWCEVFLLETDEDVGHINDDHLNYSKLAESIARASGNALLPFLDLMAVNQLKKIGIRVTLGENIKYLAGSNGDHLSPIYMNALDNELIGVIHRQTANMSRPEGNMTLELIFYILNK